MKNFIHNFVLHLGWALLNQECDCQHSYFNWLSRLLPEGDEETIEETYRFKIGCYFWDLGNRTAHWSGEEAH